MALKLRRHRWFWIFKGRKQDSPTYSGVPRISLTSVMLSMCLDKPKSTIRMSPRGLALVSKMFWGWRERTHRLDRGMLHNDWLLFKRSEVWHVRSLTRSVSVNESEHWRLMVPRRFGVWLVSQHLAAPLRSSPKPMRWDCKQVRYPCQPLDWIHGFCVQIL